MQEINVYMNGEHRYAGSGDKKTQYLDYKQWVGLGFDEFCDPEYP